MKIYILFYKYKKIYNFKEKFTSFFNRIIISLFFLF